MYQEEYHPQTLDPSEMDHLLSLGWYRMRQSMFTVSHLFDGRRVNFCRLWWLRYPVAAVREHKSHRDIRHRNRHLRVDLQESFTHEAALDHLYDTYYASIDFAGYPSIAAATMEPGERNLFPTKTITVHDGARLVAAGIFDQGVDAVASILHFYDPAYHRNSLGKYLMLLTLDHARERGLAWYYPGYIIAGDPKMDYKLFLGTETAQAWDATGSRGPGRWIPFHSRMQVAESYPRESWLRDFAPFFARET